MTEASVLERAAELARIDAVMTEAASGCGQVVVLEAPAEEAERARAADNVSTLAVLEGAHALGSRRELAEHFPKGDQMAAR